MRRRIKYSTILIHCLSLSFGQGYMNGLGIGHYYDNQGITNAGGGLTKLLPEYQSNVSLTNPSTWHHLKYTHLSLSYGSDESSMTEKSLLNGYSGLAKAVWIVPIKSKGSLGITISPYSDQRISLSDNDSTDYRMFDDTLQYKRSFNRYGGIMSVKLGASREFKGGYGFGMMFNMLFGSSRQNKSILFGGSSIVQTSRMRYSGLLMELFFTYPIKEELKIMLGSKYSLIPLDALVTTRHLFDDEDGDGYHDYYNSLDYEFPNPIDVESSNEHRMKGVHNPTEYLIGLSARLFERSSLAVEFCSFNDMGVSSSVFEPGLNDWIQSTYDGRISITRFPDDLSINWMDKFVFRSGFTLKQHTLAESKTMITENGFTLGFGFKFKVVGNQLDVNYYLGQRKYSNGFNDELIQQFQIGVGLSDLWFVKRRRKKG